MDDMDDYDVPKPFSPTSDIHSNLSSESLYHRSNSPPSSTTSLEHAAATSTASLDHAATASSAAMAGQDIYDRPPSQSRSSYGSGLNISTASSASAAAAAGNAGAGGPGSCGGSMVSGIGGGFEGSPCKLSSSTMMVTTPTGGHHQHHQQHVGHSASTFHLNGSGNSHSFLGSGSVNGSALSLSDFRASSEASLPLPNNDLSVHDSANSIIYDSPAASTTTALSPTRSIGCISTRSSSSSDMLLLGASSSDLKGSLNTIPEGKELRTMMRGRIDDDDAQPDYDVPVAASGRRVAVDDGEGELK